MQWSLHLCSLALALSHSQVYTSLSANHQESFWISSGWFIIAVQCTDAGFVSNIFAYYSNHRGSSLFVCVCDACFIKPKNQNSFRFETHFRSFSRWFSIYIYTIRISRLLSSNLIVHMMFLWFVRYFISSVLSVLELIAVTTVIATSVSLSHTHTPSFHSSYSHFHSIHIYSSDASEYIVEVNTRESTIYIEIQQNTHQFIYIYMVPKRYKSIL